jgi:ElaB/YqjD/DUF883 family membrane-anchored ribosome-binding protein
MSEVTTEKLFADFKVLINDVEQLVSATAGQQIADLRQRLSLGVEQGREGLARYEKEVREQTERAKRRTMTFLREESWSRLAAATLVGVLLGVALRRLRSKSTRSGDATVG